MLSRNPQHVTSPVISLAIPRQLRLESFLSAGRNGTPHIKSLRLAKYDATKPGPRWRCLTTVRRPRSSRTLADQLPHARQATLRRVIWQHEGGGAGKDDARTEKISYPPTQRGRLLLYKPYITRRDVRE